MVNLVILVFLAAVWFMPWYPLSGNGENYSSGVIVLQPTEGTPKELSTTYLPAGIVISASVNACEKCFIGIWHSDSYVLGTSGTSTAEFIAPRSGYYALYGVNYDTESHPVEVSLTAPSMSPWELVIRFGAAAAIVLTLPFFICAGLMIEVEMLRKTIEEASIPSATITVPTDATSKSLILDIHEYWDAARKNERYLSVLFLSLFVLVPASIIIAGFFIYLALMTGGTPSITWNNPGTFPLLIFFVLMLATSLVLVPSMFILLRFSVKWTVKLRKLREAIKTAALGTRDDTAGRS